MFFQLLIMGGGLLCTGIKTYRQLQQPKDLVEALSSETVPNFMTKADQACKQFILYLHGVEPSERREKCYTETYRIEPCQLKQSP